MTMTQVDPAHLRVASYNIQKCVGMDLRRRPDRILRVLDGIGASIVVLQEADKRLAPRPAALPHFSLQEAGWQVADLGGAGSLGWHGNAVIWRDSNIDLLAMGHIPLPGLEPRGAVWVEFSTQLGPLRVFGMHLGLIARYRRQQVKHLAEEAAAMSDMASLWAGDFNEWSRQPVLDQCAPDMSFLPPKPSFPAPRPMGALDRFAVNHRLRVVKHGVFVQAPAHMASDHLPIWVDLGRITDK
ncbi:MAG: endonuclease/exonuclease/phosphatase family protein [Rhodobacteraceae bacterium]|nr:endonuclease/exonuclease/phosphatase family protein [Paracoccaceae bacterium]